MKRSLLAGAVLIALMMASPIAFAGEPTTFPTNKAPNQKKTIKPTGEKGVLVDPAVLDKVAPTTKTGEKGVLVDPAVLDKIAPMTKTGEKGVLVEPTPAPKIAPTAKTGEKGVLVEPTGVPKIAPKKK